MLSLKNFYTAECPDGWTGYAKKCYKFFGETTSWDHAQTYCRKMGSFLASIENKETNDFISGTLLKHLPDTKPTPYLQVYIGGQQIKEGGYTGEYWAWSDGSWFGYYNWLAGNSDIGNEDCMSMFLTTDPIHGDVCGAWNDVSCDRDNWFPYICAKPLLA